MLNSILAGVQGSYKKKGGPKKADPLAALQKAAQEREQAELDAFRSQARTMIDKLVANPKETDIRFPPYEDRRKRYIIHGEAAEVGLVSRGVTLEEDPDGPKHLFVWKSGHEPERIRQIDAISRVSNESRNNALAFSTVSKPPAKKPLPAAEKQPEKQPSPSSSASPETPAAPAAITGRKRASPDATSSPDTPVSPSSSGAAEDPKKAVSEEKAAPAEDSKEEAAVEEPQQKKVKVTPAEEKPEAATPPKSADAAKPEAESTEAEPQK